MRIYVLKDISYCRSKIFKAVILDLEFWLFSIKLVVRDDKLI